MASVSPAADAFRDRAAGDEISFVVGMSATTPSAAGGGEVILSFQGHKVGVRSSPLSTAHAVHESCFLRFFASLLLCFFVSCPTRQDKADRCLALTDDISGLLGFSLPPSNRTSGQVRSLRRQVAALAVVVDADKTLLIVRLSPQDGMRTTP